MVLAFIVAGTILTLAALAYARTSLRAGMAYEEHNTEFSRERDVLTYLVQSIRVDRSKGVEGDTRSATVAAMSASCTGETGSGQQSGAGRTDRVITCSTPSIDARYRIFDRSGDQTGIIVETLSSTTTG